MKESNYEGVILFIVSVLVVLTSFYLIDFGYNINLSHHVYLVEKMGQHIFDVGSFESNLKYNYLSVQVVPYIIPCLLSLYLPSIVAVKLTVILSVVLSSLLLSRLLFLKHKSLRLLYMFLPALFGYHFIWFDFSSIVALPIFLYCVLILSRTHVYTENTGFLLLLFSILIVFSSPQLYFAFVIFLFIRLFSSEFSTKKTGGLLALLMPSLIWFFYQVLGSLVMLEHSYFTYSFKTVSHFFAGIFSLFYVSDEFDVFGILIPALFILSPLVLGYRFTIKPSYWVYFLASVTLFAFEPLYVAGVGHWGYGLIVLPLMFIPFLYVQKTEPKILSKVVVVFLALVLPFSYVTKSISTDIETRKLSVFSGVDLSNKAVWYDVAAPKFQGLFYEDVYLGSSIIHFQDVRLGYSLFDRKIFPLSNGSSSTQYDPILFRGKWRDAQHMQKYDYLLLYNCGSVKVDLVPYNLLMKSYCWELYSIDK